VEQTVARLCERGVAANKIKIACLGLTFKPDIDDLRESPALKIAETLARKYPGQVAVTEPNIETLPSMLSALGVIPMRLHEVQQWADILLLLVPHRQFQVIQLLSGDGRILLDAMGIEQKGLPL
jgi:UDP-N-acetyl-D-mannosaminuronic acid dehydrogenase